MTKEDHEKEIERLLNIIINIVNMHDDPSKNDRMKDEFVYTMIKEFIKGIDNHRQELKKLKKFNA